MSKVRFGGWLVVAMAAMLSACAYQPTYNSEPVTVEKDELSRYWVATQEKITFKATGGSQEIAAAQKGGEVSGYYWIDSNGKVTRVEIYKSEPDGVFNEAMTKYLNRLEYKPAPANTQRQPVKVRFEMKFDYQDVASR